MKVTNKAGRVVEVTERAYEVLYKDRGFKPVGNEESGLASKTKKELQAILETYNIEYSKRSNKEELISLIYHNVEG